MESVAYELEQVNFNHWKPMIAFINLSDTVFDKLTKGVTNL